MADEMAVQELLARLSTTPVRDGSILDMPFEEYVEGISSPDVAILFEAYVREHRRPTLRSILLDSRFRRWVAVAGRAPLAKKLELELTIVSGVVSEEDHILEPAPGVVTCAGATRGSRNPRRVGRRARRGRAPA